MQSKQGVQFIAELKKRDLTKLSSPEIEMNEHEIESRELTELEDKNLGPGDSPSKGDSTPTNRSIFPLFPRFSRANPSEQSPPASPSVNVEEKRERFSMQLNDNSQIETRDIDTSGSLRKNTNHIEMLRVNTIESA